MHPSLAGYSPLLAEAASDLPAQYDFVGDGLSGSEKEVMDWADSRLFSNESFLESRWGPDNWPSDVWTASVQAIPLLMLEIDIQKKANGKHVINWEVDSLDRVLDGLGIYEGVCVHCYGKTGYDTRARVNTSYASIVYNQQHIHREMLKTFAYYAKADGEGMLVRSLMENVSDDFDMLYKRDLGPGNVHQGSRYNRNRTLTAFGWRNLSFMSQVELPGGVVKSFPTMVYEIIGDSEGEREAAERWFGHINRELIHFTGDGDDFANLFRPYSQTPYTPEPGYILIVGEAGSPSSTGLTVSAFRMLGLKAEQFLSPGNGYRTGGVEIGGEWYYHDGNTPLGTLGGTKDKPMCLFLAPLDVVENRTWDDHCGFKGSFIVGGAITGEIIGDKVNLFSSDLEKGHTYRISASGNVSEGGTLTRLVVSICIDGSWQLHNCQLISEQTEGVAKDPAIIYTARRDGVHHIRVSGVDGAVGTFTLGVS